MKNMKRMTYIDGVKGLCTLSICVLHFLLAFYNKGFVGWNCAPEAAENPINYYFDNFPYSIVTNNSFPLYVFMALIAFIPAYRFFLNKNRQSIIKQGINRYFRFMPMVLAACLLMVALSKMSLLPAAQYQQMTGNTWVGANDISQYSFLDAIFNGLFRGYLYGIDLITSLWCLDQLFLGSLLTYAALLLVGEAKHRGVLYVVIALFFVYQPAYLAFLGGIAAADGICNTSLKEKKGLAWGIFLGGMIIGHFPIVLLPGWCDAVHIYAIGSSCICMSVPVLFENNRLLNSKVLTRVGKESFSAIIVHILVLFSVNLNLFIYLNGFGMVQWLNILVNFFVFVVLSVFVSLAFGKILNPLSNYLCKKNASFFFQSF